MNKVDKGLFGTSGIRGDAEKLFTREFCIDIAATFVEFLRRNNMLSAVAIGMDPRTSSPRIKQDLITGFTKDGIEVFDEGVTPIPSINWLIKSTPVRAAIMITGSHIAPELNGLKFYAHDEEISYEDQLKIEEIYKAIKETRDYAVITPESHLEDKARILYSEMLSGRAEKSFKKWKIALDCANGAQSTVMPELLKSLGFTIFEVNCDPQKDFLARDTDTDDQAKIEDIKKLVVDEQLDFGIAFDGDGDRVVFIDEKGSFVHGEYSCSLIAKDMPGEELVTTISASQVVDTLGKKVYRTKVGSPYVIGKIKETGASFGFEPNGGAIFPDVMFTRDGGSMMIRMLNKLNGYEGTLSELVATLPKFYMERTKVEYEWDLKDKIISEAKEKFKGVKIEELDGLKIWIDDNTWLLFRSSANAPEFRVFAESKDPKTAKKLLEDGVEFVNTIVNAK